MKILITGVAGMLGSDLSKILSRQHEVVQLSRNDLDITERDRTIQIVKSASPDVLINCAAYTMVDQAENERDRAFEINGMGCQNLALACEEADIPLCHISTDYVFNGKKKRPYTPFDQTDPINTYGESKLAGEQYVQWISSKFYIVRTSWLYGKNRNNFVYTILKLCEEKDELRIVNDQIGSPTWTVSLSQGIAKLIETGAFGIYHITDDTDDGISWFDFAREIIELIKCTIKITPIPTEQYPTPARRPMNSVLDLSMNEAVFGYKAPSWKLSLHEFLTER